MKKHMSLVVILVMLALAASTDLSIPTAQAGSHEQPAKKGGFFKRIKKGVKKLFGRSSSNSSAAVNHNYGNNAQAANPQGGGGGIYSSANLPRATQEHEYEAVNAPLEDGVVYDTVLPTVATTSTANHIGAASTVTAPQGSGGAARVQNYGQLAPEEREKIYASLSSEELVKVMAAQQEGAASTSGAVNSKPSSIESRMAKFGVKVMK